VKYNQRVTTEQVQAAVAEAGSKRAAARLLGVDPATVRAHLKQVADVPDALTSARPIEKLLEDRNAEFGRVAAVAIQRELVPVRILLDGPIGLVHCGDAHLDDPGTNLARLEADCTIIRETDGMLGANVGDYINNWVGRLTALYAEQTTTAEEAWALVAWYLGLCEWAYLIGGNHDHWSGTGDPLKWIARHAGTHLQYHGARFELRFTNGRKVIVNARHDFRGWSQWNEAHGPAKAARIGWRDHILVCGHKHTNGYQILRNPDPQNPIISHAIRVASYKIHDSFAHQIGAQGNPISAAVTTIIDPDATRESGLVQVFHDLEMAADYLTFLRRRFTKLKGAANATKTRKRKR